MVTSLGVNVKDHICTISEGKKTSFSIRYDAPAGTSVSLRDLSGSLVFNCPYLNFAAAGLTTALKFLLP